MAGRGCAVASGGQQAKFPVVASAHSSFPCFFLSAGKFYCKPHYCYRLSGYAQRKRPAVAPLSGKVTSYEWDSQRGAAVGWMQTSQVYQLLVVQVSETVLGGLILSRGAPCCSP